MDSLNPRSFCKTALLLLPLSLPILLALCSSASGADPCQGFFNPCGPGACTARAGGAYTCACPAPSQSATRADGLATCALPASSLPPCTQTYNITGAAPETCDDVSAAYGLTLEQLAGMNPGLNCSFTDGILPGEAQICVARSTTPPVACTAFFAVKQGDSCPQIAASVGISQLVFYTINPGIQCQAPYLLVGTTVCIDRGAVPSGTLSPVNQPCRSQCQGEPQKPVCGIDGVTYDNQCQAKCSAALPATAGKCTACQLACVGHSGFSPVPSTACNKGYVCPSIVYKENLVTSISDAFKKASFPLCAYQQSQCQRLCTYKPLHVSPSEPVNPAAKYHYCLTQCLGCSNTPCHSPKPNSIPIPDLVLIGSPKCPQVGGPLCQAPVKTIQNRRYATAKCDYWRTKYLPPLSQKCVIGWIIWHTQRERHNCVK